VISLYSLLEYTEYNTSISLEFGSEVTKNIEKSSNLDHSIAKVFHLCCIRIQVLEALRNSEQQRTVGQFGPSQLSKVNDCNRNFYS